MEEERNRDVRYRLMFRFDAPAPDRITAHNIREFFYMIPIDNLPSVLENGLLSHRRIDKQGIRRVDVSNEGVQARRAATVIERVDPAKRPRSLHRFVNLYLNPHNAMMINVIHGGEGVVAKPRNSMCILRIRAEILERGDVILTDQNASTNDVNFFTSEAYELDERRTTILTHCEAVGYKRLQSLASFKRMDAEEITKLRKQTRQAEALVPYRVEARYIFGIFVCDEATAENLRGVLNAAERTDISVTVNNELFLPSKFTDLDHYQPRPEHEDAMDAEEHELPSSDASDDEFEHAVPLRRPRV